MKKFILILLTCFVFGQSSNESSMTIYKDGTALVKQEILWSNVSKGKSTINYRDIPKSIHRDTPFINIENAQEWPGDEGDLQV